MPRSSLPAILTALAVAGAAAPALGATAHNSQAGSWGPTSNHCAPTPYFPAGGCASAVIAEDRFDAFDVPARPYPPRRPLSYPRGPLLDPND